MKDCRIVYISTISGALEIWTMNEDGTEPLLLTINAGTFNDFPSPTRGRRFVVFLSNRNGTYQVWRMDIDGRNSEQLSKFNQSQDFSLGLDNQVYYLNNAPDGKGSRCYKVTFECGESVKFDVPSFALGVQQFSPDGKWIFYFNVITKGKPISSGLVKAATGKVVRPFEGGLIYTRWFSSNRSLRIQRFAAVRFYSSRSRVDVCCVEINKRAVFRRNISFAFG